MVVSLKVQFELALAEGGFTPCIDGQCVRLGEQLLPNQLL